MVQRVLIGLHVRNRLGRDAAFHRGLGHSRGHHAHQARVKGFRDQVFRAKGHALVLIGGGGFGAGGGAGEGGDAFDATDLHRVVDLGGADVQRATENEWETQDVVHLIGIV